MNRSDCLAEDRLLDLVYGELSAEEAGQAEAHARTCPACRSAIDDLRRLIGSLQVPETSGGHRAVQGAIRFLGLDEEAASQPASGPGLPDILTIEDVAAYVRVSPENVRNLLHLIPHFVFDGQIRIRRPVLLKFLEDLEKQSSKALSGSSVALPRWQQQF